MAPVSGKRSAASAHEHAPKKPLFERVQDWVAEMDVGGGGGLFRVGMFLMLVLLVILLYTGTQFYGLRDPEAMDIGQLARNVSRGEGYVTRVVRPLEMWWLNQRGKPPVNPATGTQPELFTPPVYPYLVAALIKVVRPDFQAVPGGRTLKADRLLMVFSWWWFLVGMVLLYLLARELFDHRVAVLSVFLYVFCDSILDFAVSGLPMNFLTVMFLLTVYGVVKADKWEAARRSTGWVYGALGTSALMVGIGTLTQYSFAAVLLPLLIYVGVSFPKQWTRRVALCLAVFCLVLAPWVVRNWQVARTVFGLSHYKLYEGTALGTPNAIQAGQLQRTLELDPSALRGRSLIRQGVLNAQEVYRVTVKEVGANYLIAFFLVGLLHRWRSEEVFRLRRFVFWVLLIAAGWLSVTGPATRNALTMIMPLVIMYAAAFFYVMFERLQLRTRLLRAAVIGAFGVLNGAPVVYTLLPPATTLAYPPYEGGTCAAMAGLFSQDATFASDIPWAMAWYGDRATVWLPRTQAEYTAINDEIRFISAVYITQATLQNLSALELSQNLSGGNPQHWLRFFPIMAPPADFPLKSVEYMTPDRQQFLLSNRRLPTGP